MIQSFLQLQSLRHSLLTAMLVLLTQNICLSQDVDPLTGRAIVNLSLAKVSAQDLSVNVGLSHSGGALKVADGPGNAGMGWNVSMAGSISREVRGLPDEYNVSGDTRKGWLYNNNANALAIQNFFPSGNNDLSDCTDENADWTFINNLAYNNDPEPDIFYFSAPGLSGKFIYGSDGIPKLIPYQDLQITGSIATGFTIKTNTGMVYTFGATDIVTRQAFQYKLANINYWKTNYNYYKKALKYTTAWNLLSLQSQATGAAVNYNYTAGEQQTSTQYISVVQPGYSTKADTLYSMQDLYQPQLLTTITLKNYTINISWANALVSKVTVNESETGDSRGYNFKYGAVKSTADNKQPLIYKPFLLSVQQQNSCTSFPSYKFSYQGITKSVSAFGDTTYSISVPWRTNWGQDFFGYYNGNDTNGNVPTVYFYQGETGARRYRVTPISSGATLTQSFPGGSGCQPSTNVNVTAIGSLQRIDYPTGGITLYTYEPNKYFDATVGEELLGPGIRVASVVSFSNDEAYGKTAKKNLAGYHTTLSKSYTYTQLNSSTTSGKILYPPSFAFTDGNYIYRTQTNLAPESSLLYSRITETLTGQGYKVYTYDLPNMYPDGQPTATLNQLARPLQANGYCPTSVGYLQNGIYSYPFAPLQDLDYKRAFLTSVSEFTTAGLLTSKTRMTYVLPQTFQTIKALRYESIPDAQGNVGFHYSLYNIPYAQSRILSQQVNLTVGDESQSDSTKVTTAYTYNSKNMVVQTGQTASDGSVQKTYVQRAMDYAISSPTPGDGQATAIYQLNLANRSGQAIEQYQTFTPLNGTESTTGAQLTIYQYNSTTGKVTPYQTKQFPQGRTFTASIASTGATQGFVVDSEYILGSTLSYSSDGYLLNATDMSKTTTGTHYATGTGLPLATFANCNAENAISDGFEFLKSYNLAPGGNTTSPVRTGQKALLINTGVIYTSSTVTKNQINGTTQNSYRVSLWANAAQATNITVQAVGGITQTITLSYTTTGQWAYLEGTIDVTNVTAPFVFKVSTNAAITIDDFVALPQSARVSLKTYLPLTGMTSQTDDRGNSVVTNYDVMGRPVNTLDHQRNLVEVKDYGFATSTNTDLSATFTCSAPMGLNSDGTSSPQLTTLTPVTFYGPSNCSTSTYQWTIINAQGTSTNAGSGANMTYTFPSFGPYSVQLTVTSQSGGVVSYIQNYNVNISANTTFNVAMTGGTTTHYYCDGGVRNFSVSLPLPQNMSMPGVLNWYVYDTNGTLVDSNLADGRTSCTLPNYAVNVKFTITVTGTIANGTNAPWVSPPQTLTTIIPFNYVYNTPCQ